MLIWRIQFSLAYIWHGTGRNERMPFDLKLMFFCSLHYSFWAYLSIIKFHNFPTLSN